MLKETIITAAIIATTTLNIPAQADYYYHYRPILQCTEPYQGHEVEPQPNAYEITLETSEGQKVEYKVDNQFSTDTGVPNIAVFYNTPMDSFVLGELRRICAEDNEVESCVVTDLRELAPGPRTDGVNARPDGFKYE